MSIYGIVMVDIEESVGGYSEADFEEE